MNSRCKRNRLLRRLGRPALGALFAGVLGLAPCDESRPAALGARQPAAKPRVVVMTDIGGDPDDMQSMVRFLLYACDVDVEGLCTGFGHGHYRNTRPELIREAVDAYGQVLPNLHKHRPDYPSHKRLRSLIKDGHNGDPHQVGPGMDSEASDWIIRVLDRDDPRPVWFTIWGGPRELAQAIWKLQRTRAAGGLAALKQKIRVHSIADQDRTAGWVKQHHPDVFWIYSNALFRGIWQEGDQSLVSPAWLEKHVRTGHGPMGRWYPAKASGKDGVKEGDTPSFFYVLPNGLSDPEHPEWGNWGGRFRRSGRGSEYLPAHDLVDGRPDMLYTIHRWREAYQNEFQARMDWCVKPYSAANHAPTAVLNEDRTRNVLQQEVAPGAKVRLAAAGSTDPDGHRLRYRWWVYREPGTYWAAPPIQGADRAEATVTVPAEASGRTIHVILEVTDRGDPPLTAYRRMVLRVGGKPVPPPPGAVGVLQDLDTPITKLPGPGADSGSWRFWRGINLNGGTVTIDGHRWDGEDAGNFTSNGRALNSPEVSLRPPTDAARAKMIHSFRWGSRFEGNATGVPSGTYAVYVYVWEETAPTAFDVAVEGRVVVKGYQSGMPGQWRRLGPWTVPVEDGRITITARGGDANFSGIEIWRRVAQRRR